MDNIERLDAEGTSMSNAYNPALSALSEHEWRAWLSTSTNLLTQSLYSGSSVENCQNSHV